MKVTRWPGEMRFPSYCRHVPAVVARQPQGTVLLGHLCARNAHRSVWPPYTVKRTARELSLVLLQQHRGMEQHGHRLFKLQDDGSRQRTVPPPRSSPRHRLVFGLGQHGRKLVTLPTCLVGLLGWRGEFSKIAPPLAERPTIFISETEFNDTALFFKKWKGRYLKQDSIVS